jgi:hypothetical protein
MFGQQVSPYDELSIVKSKKSNMLFKDSKGNKANGVYGRYYKNGSMLFKVNIKKGKANGKMIFYTLDGKKIYSVPANKHDEINKRIQYLDSLEQASQYSSKLSKVIFSSDSLTLSIVPNAQTEYIYIFNKNAFHRLLISEEHIFTSKGDTLFFLPDSNSSKPLLYEYVLSNDSTRLTLLPSDFSNYKYLEIGYISEKNSRGTLWDFQENSPFIYGAYKATKSVLRNKLFKIERRSSSRYTLEEINNTFNYR